MRTQLLTTINQAYELIQMGSRFVRIEFGRLQRSILAKLSGLSPLQHRESLGSATAHATHQAMPYAEATQDSTQAHTLNDQANERGLCFFPDGSSGVGSSASRARVNGLGVGKPVED